MFSKISMVVFFGSVALSAVMPSPLWGVVEAVAAAVAAVALIADK